MDLELGSEIGSRQPAQVGTKLWVRVDKILGLGSMEGYKFEPGIGFRVWVLQY